MHESSTPNQINKLEKKVEKALHHFSSLFSKKARKKKPSLSCCCSSCRFLFPPTAATDDHLLSLPPLSLSSSRPSTTVALCNALKKGETKCYKTRRD